MGLFSAERVGDLFSETWVIGWCFAAVVGLIYWGFMIREIRQNKRIMARITLVCLFGLLTAVEFCCFIQLLRIAPYSKYSFLLSVVAPCILFYGALFIFANGVLNAITKACRRKKFNIITGFNAYLPYTWCIPVAELAWAMAYSCTFGIMLAGGKAAFTGIQYYIYFTLKKGVRRSNNKKKEHKQA